MSNFFYKGRKEKKPKHESFGYNTERSVKDGSPEHPLSLMVQTEERAAEINEILQANELCAEIAIDDAQPENIIALDILLNKPVTTVFEKTPNRNDPCSCGSGKKYKKCCA